MTTADRTTKGEATRARLLDAALKLFRKKGLEHTTMREVAAAAGMAVGGAYFYFPSKTHIVLAWYAQQQEEHALRVKAILEESPDFQTRLQRTLHAKVDLVAKDRKLLAALLGPLMEPQGPLGVFSSETRALREESQALFDGLLAGQGLAPASERLLGSGLWLLHLGIIWVLVGDTTKGQQRTRRLIDQASFLLGGGLPLASLPMVEPLLAQVHAVLAEAGLMGDKEEAS